MDKAFSPRISTIGATLVSLDVANSVLRVDGVDIVSH
jgi:hypothetical protein